MDRKVYLPQEPIVVEWALTNTSPTTLTVPDVWEGRHLHFTCSVPGRRPFPLSVPGIACGPPELVLLGGGQSLRGWFFLSSTFEGWPGWGEFKLLPTCSTGYFITAIADFVPRRLEAEELTLRIDSPTGRDAEAHKFIKRSMAAKMPRLFTDEPPALASEDTGEREEASRQYWLNIWYAEIYGPIRSELVRGVKSSRYHPVALYELGIEVTRDYSHGDQVPEDFIDRSVKHFTACLDGEDCSPFMRAIVRLGRAEVLFRSPREEDVMKAEQDAIAVMREYPRTAFAEKAKRMLRLR